MLLSFEPRVQYEKNQLLEVICQFRFPTILRIEAEEPAQFQERIRQMFPQYSVRLEALPVLPGQQPQQTKNYHFVSTDGRWKLNLTKGFISLSSVAYHNWEGFARRIDQPLAAFIEIYQPSYFERVGLRYMNGFSKQNLGEEDIRWRDWIQPHFLGILAEDDTVDGAVRRNNVEVETMLPSGVMLKTHAGPGMVKQNGTNPQQPDSRFILDNDLSVIGKLTAQQAVEALPKLHESAFRVFRGAITDDLHEAMIPIE